MNKTNMKNYFIMLFISITLFSNFNLFCGEEADPVFDALAARVAGILEQHRQNNTQMSNTEANLVARYINLKEQRDKAKEEKEHLTKQGILLDKQSEEQDNKNRSAKAKADQDEITNHLGWKTLYSLPDILIQGLLIDFIKKSFTTGRQSLFGKTAAEEFEAQNTAIQNYNQTLQAVAGLSKNDPKRKRVEQTAIVGLLRNISKMSASTTHTVGLWSRLKPSEQDFHITMTRFDNFLDRDVQILNSMGQNIQKFSNTSSEVAEIFKVKLSANMADIYTMLNAVYGSNNKAHIGSVVEQAENTMAILEELKQTGNVKTREYISAHEKELNKAITKGYELIVDHDVEVAQQNSEIQIKRNEENYQSSWINHLINKIPFAHRLSTNYSYQ